MFDSPDKKIRRLEAELAAAQKLVEHHQRRAELAEASSKRAWEMAVWGGQRREQEPDHAEG